MRPWHEARCHQWLDHHHAWCLLPLHSKSAKRISLLVVVALPGAGSSSPTCREGDSSFCLSSINFSVHLCSPTARPAKMGYNADTMSFEVPNTDTVYISGLPAGTTESSKQLQMLHPSSVPCLGKRASVPCKRRGYDGWQSGMLGPGSCLQQRPAGPPVCDDRVGGDDALAAHGGWPAGMAEFFGSIGIIKMDKKSRPPKPKIWLYRDKNTGELKGDGTVTYDDPFSAASAVEWFNKKDWKGAAAAQMRPWIWNQGGVGTARFGCRAKGA